MFLSRFAGAPTFLDRGVKSATRSRSESTVSDVSSIVNGILQDIKQGGNRDSDNYCAKFDHLPRKKLQVIDVEQRFQRCTQKDILDIKCRHIVRRAAQPHRDSLKDVGEEMQPGITIGSKHIPIRNVGCYVPAHMSVLTAKVTGRDRVVACAAPMLAWELGRRPHTTIAVLPLAGAAEMYVMRGAQAIGALAALVALVVGCKVCNVTSAGMVDCGTGQGSMLEEDVWSELKRELSGLDKSPQGEVPVPSCS